MRTRCTDLLSALRLAIDSASEQGRTEPDQPARAYLKTIAGDPEAVHLPANGYTLFGLKVVLGPDGFHMTFEYPGISASEYRPRRAMEVDGSSVDIFPLPVDEASLEALLRDLFENHWREIVFGPIIEGAAYEFRTPSLPTHIGTFDGYLTIAFGAPHFHICIGEHNGAPSNPASPALARHRRTLRAELYRRLDCSGAPVSWGLRLFNGEGEQQITVLLPNPFLDQDSDRCLQTPEWSRLALWDSLRARWLGLDEPDPLDRSGEGFHHD